MFSESNSGPDDQQFFEYDERPYCTDSDPYRPPDFPPIEAYGGDFQTPDEGGYQSGMDFAADIVPVDQTGETDYLDISATTEAPHLDRPSLAERMIGVIKSDTTIAERHPDWPKIKLHFHFSAHVTESHFSELADRIAQADVYCFENTAGNGSVGFFQKLANGEKFKDQQELEAFIDDTTIEYRGKEMPLKGTATAATLKALHNSNVIVGHFDMRPAEHEREAQWNSDYTRWSTYNKASNYGKFLQTYTDI
jgi:hypothetical protein